MCRQQRSPQLSDEQYRVIVYKALAIVHQRPGLSLPRFLRALGYSVPKYPFVCRKRRHWRRSWSLMIARMEREHLIVVQKTYPWGRADYYVYPFGEAPPLALPKRRKIEVKNKQLEVKYNFSFSSKIFRDTISAFPSVLSALRLLQEGDGGDFVYPSEIEYQLIRAGNSRNFTYISRACSYLHQIGILDATWQASKRVYRVPACEFCLENWVIESPGESSSRLGQVAAPGLVRWDDSSCSALDSNITFHVNSDRVNDARILVSLSTFSLPHAPSARKAIAGLVFQVLRVLEDLRLPLRTIEEVLQSSPEKQFVSKTVAYLQDLGVLTRSLQDGELVYSIATSDTIPVDSYVVECLGTESERHGQVVEATGRILKVKFGSIVQLSSVDLCHPIPPHRIVDAQKIHQAFQKRRRA